MNISNEEYGELTKRRSHNSKLCRTIPMAFLIGGLICTLGEALLNLYGMAGLNKDEAGALTSITLVFLSILFTGLEWYDRIAQHAGAGTLVPITGFANAVASRRWTSKARASCWVWALRCSLSQDRSSFTA